VPAERIDPRQIAPIHTRRATGLQLASRLCDRDPELSELGFERRGARLEHLPMRALAQEEGLLALNEIQPVAFGRVVVLCVEMSQTVEIHRRLNDRR